jgi:hypothetical protein
VKNERFGFESQPHNLRRRSIAGPMRTPHKGEIVGSNPTAATYNFQQRTAMKIYVWEIESDEHAILRGEIQALRLKPFAHHIAEEKFPGMKKCKLIGENGEEFEFVPDPPLNNGSYVNWELLANMTEEELDQTYDDLKNTFGSKRADPN